MFFLGTKRTEVRAGLRIADKFHLQVAVENVMVGRGSDREEREGYGLM